MKPNFSSMLNSSYLLPDKNYESLLIKKLSQKNLKDNHDEPCFYDQGVYDIPIVKTFLERFDEVEKEILNYCENQIMFDFPRFEIKNNVYIYDNKWEIAPISKLTSDNYRLNQDMLEVEKNNKVIANSSSFSTSELGKPSVENILSDGIEKKDVIDSVKHHCPITNSIIEELENKNILENSYISKLYPGCIIRPHIDKHINLLRFHLGIQGDQKCTLTVGNETRPWERSKFLIFNHCGKHLHSVRHSGTIPRISLAFDLAREYVMEFIND